ncbi:uncharacterized protein LOC133176205 [Saccostrea echinata]|uniref:uncharacterized protein LOC133176205 n=1 Tax=Saccostrea echinata TaxID=191078 RepID=UPI002A815A25|nr:uncharacterized protein LOC133176205 [Saccostrea echinata]
MADNDIEFLLTKNNEEKNVNEPYWSKLEKEILYEEASQRVGVLDSKFRGAQCGISEKNRAWEEITAIVDAKGTTKKRTMKQVKKQWSNMKQRAKKLNSQGKYPVTGGGPKPPSPSPIDEAVLSLLSGRPSLEGVEGGLETQNIPNLYEPGPSSCSTAQSTTLQTETSPKDTSRKRKININDIHVEVLFAEKEKLKLEMEYIKLKMKKVSSEIELIEMKKNSLMSSSCLSLSQFTEL